jgi:hypothetical protein
MIVRRKIKQYSLPTPPPGKTVQQGLPGDLQQGMAQQAPDEVTMRDLQLEQARLQRQQTQIQHQKSQLLLKNEMARRREVVQLQKIKKDGDDERVKNAIRARKEESDNNDEAKARNASLYKSKPKLVQPVGMPKK